MWQGKPQEVPDELGVEEWVYKLSTPQGLCCEVFLKHGVVDTITIETAEVSETEAVRFFGGGFKPVRYRLGDDAPQTGSAPSCEDQNGAYTVLLNPQTGQALWETASRKIKQSTFSATNPIQKCGLRTMKK